MKIFIGISGASGAIYAKRLIEYTRDKHELYIVASDNAQKIFGEEIHESFNHFVKSNNLMVFNNDDLFAPISSGSFVVDAYIVIPCSMKTLASIANGYAESLISRCCDVALKENRKIIVVPREMPLSIIHLENMLKLSKMGVKVVVPSAPFYNHPNTINDMINSVVGKILDLLKINNNIYTRWKE